MPFALLDLLRSMRNRVKPPKSPEGPPVSDGHMPGVSGLSSRDRRNHYNEEFARHCRQRRFY